uniref:SEH1-like (S. cerevisiae) n=1 Tax=Eptatretus burgeri TaxID=7764 RepID=A0A8C4Q4M0_EPTBU
MCVCSCFLTPPTSRLDEPPPASRLHPRLASSTRLPGPAHYSTLTLWTLSFSTQAPPSEHRLHTCGLGQRQRDYCRVPHHGASPPPKLPECVGHVCVMYVAHRVSADHKDLIHDVAYDFHGQRLATCSSDQSVKVWDRNENSEWICTASWKTHCGSVWRVTWAHPEFGQVLASCSSDRTAAIWEEVVGESTDRQRTQSHWVKRTTLVDSRTSVTDVRFGPKHLGLVLAACSADGVIRLYEAPDIMELSQWSLQHELSCRLSCSCISWNPSCFRGHPPMLAVGSDDSSISSGGKVQVFEYNENTRKYGRVETLLMVPEPVHDLAFAPNLGRSCHLLAIASRDVRIIQLKPLRREGVLSQPVSPGRFETQQLAQFDGHGAQVWRVAWNATGTVLASSGDDGCVRLWKANYLGNWKCVGVLKGDGSPVQGDGAGSAQTVPGCANTSGGPITPISGFPILNGNHAIRNRLPCTSP